MQIAKSGYLPSLTFSMGFSAPYFRSSNIPFSDQLKDNSQADIGLSLSIPIFNKFRNRTNMANAQVGILTAENEIEKTKQDIYKLIQSAHNDVVASRENFNARKQAVTASEESFRFAEQRFNAGAISAIDYSLEKNKVNQASSRLLQSKYDLLVKLKILDFYRGAEVQL
jgi:outer membrane protein